MARAQDLMSTAYRRFIAEIPPLDRLKLMIRIELRGRGDVQIFGVRIPGPEIIKGEPEAPRVEITMPRRLLTELAEAGKVADWRAAYAHGDVRVVGDPNVIKLVATVIERHQARAPFRGRPDGA